MSKKSRKSKYLPQPKELPAPPAPDFANQILELEMRIDTEKSIEALQSLLAIYSQVIEYFEATGDPRFLYFKDRMHSMISSKEHIFAPASLQKSKTSSSLKLRVEREADDVLRKHENQCQSTLKLLQSNLVSQSASLGERLKSRQFQRQETERYDKELENVIEENLVNKHKQIQSIKKRYLRSREDLLKAKNKESRFQEILSQVELSMVKEIKQVESQMDCSRKNEIIKFKDRFAGFYK